MKKFTKAFLIVILSAIVFTFLASIIESNYSDQDITKIDAGDTAFIAIAAILVMLMTPALGFFYAGLVSKKNLVSILVQSIIIFSIVSVIWALWGYSLAFGGSSGFIGDSSFVGLKDVGFSPNEDYAGTIPALLFFFFQLKFAAITPALIIGAFAERIKFSSLLIFIILWVTLIYAPVAHWVWGTGGWLRSMGALDFAGGTVVHILAGFSALAGAIVVGRRKNENKQAKPNNIPFVILGTALLWFGWFGFNGGSALAANGLAINALVVTNIAAACAALSWMFMDWIVKGKPTATGTAIGAVCGLVAITPASGFVGPLAAIAIGLIAGLVSNLVSNWRLERTKLDDTLDVFACHGVSGVWGALATGIFASTAINAAGANGLLFGNPGQIWIQIVAILASAAFAFIGSLILFKIIKKIMGLRVSEEDEIKGLDITQHGEHAYED